MAAIVKCVGMLRFVGTSTTSIPEEFVLSEDVITIGRDAKCDLVLDSVDFPRMISRVHAKLTKTQPASAAIMRGASRLAARVASRLQTSVTTTSSPRWLLTDNGSVNGVFVNEIKVQSTLLTHGDVITIGGMGQKIAIGTHFPQPNAEFIFHFLQQPSAPAAAQDDATLPMPLPADAHDSHTLPHTSDVQTSSHRLANDEEDGKEAPSASASAMAGEEEEDGPTQLLGTDQPNTATDKVAASATGSPTHSASATGSPTHSVGDVEEDGEGPTQLLPAAESAAADSEDEDNPTQLLPPVASTVVGSADENNATQLLPPTVVAEHASSDEDSATQLLPPEPQQTSPAVRLPRTFSEAPTQVAASEAAPVQMEITEDEVPEIHAAPAHATGAVAAPVAPHGGLDIHAYRAAASLDEDATMSEEDDRHRMGTRAMSIDGTFHGTQVLPSSQAATQHVNESTAAASSISASLMDGFGGVGLATQTQVLPAFAGEASATGTPAKPVSKKAMSKSDLYDDDEDEAPAVIAAASSSATFASPAAATSSKAATPASSSKKRSRLVAEEILPSYDDADAAVEVIPSDPEDEGVHSHKRRRVERKKSSGDQCPVCMQKVAPGVLEAHVEACLVASANDEAEAAARKLAAELEAADEKEAAAARSYYKPARAAKFEDEEDEEDEDESYDDFPAAPYPAAAASAAAYPAARAAAASVAVAADAGPKSACPLCDKLFPDDVLIEHADVCEGPDESCPLCSKKFLPSQVAGHARSCKGPDKQCLICEANFPPDQLDTHQSRCVGKGGRECSVCMEIVAGCEYEAHYRRCVQREIDMSQDEKMAMGFQRGEQQRELVNEMQTRAIKWVEEQARRQSEAAYPALLARFKSLGYSELDLKRTIRYIRNDAPLIIHVNLTKCMKFFVADTHYRNQFETKTSCGTLSASARSGWENGLFNKIYAKASGYDRVKYGVLNIVQDPNGVLACRAYGDSYLLLKSETMRLRTSFASRDTGGGTARLASCEWYTHVLAEYSDPELADVISVATRAKRAVSSARIHSYKEVQYHGPVEFGRDVEALVVNGRHASDKAMMVMVEQFCKQNSCNCIMMEADGC